MPDHEERAQTEGHRGRILWVAAEISPWASAGGLGEVVRTLPPALSRLGWAVSVLVPAHRELARARKPGESQVVWRGDVELDRQTLPVRVFVLRESNGVDVLLLDCPRLYDRPGVYGDDRGAFPDNDVRFGVLCRVAARLARARGLSFDLVHAHDWHAALVPGLLAAHPGTARPGSAPPSVLTIHNLAHQGVFGPDTLHRLRLDGADFASRARGGSAVNFLEAGIRWADALTTVSPTYAREVVGQTEGERLGTLLHERGEDFVGVLNGIDADDWDPRADTRLAATYGSATLSGKGVNKTALQKELGLSLDARAPLLGFFGRFAPQKGLDLFLEAIPRLLRKGAQAAVAGGGDPGLERRAEELAARFPGRVAARVGYDPDLSHRFLAGIDVLVMPSRFEPCGLTQLQALRMGTIPVAHAVGGLVDTVHPMGTRGAGRAPGNGFLFHASSTRGLSLALGKALRYYDQPELWRTLQRNAMATEVSWRPAARIYDQLYGRLVGTGRRSGLAPTPPGPTDPAPDPPPAEAASPGTTERGPVLPDRYGESVLQLLVQSPHLLYAYWELSHPDDPLELELEEASERRVIESRVSPVGEAWIPGRPDRDYRVRLRQVSKGVLLGSNRVRTPPAAARPGGEPRWRRLGPGTCAEASSPSVPTSPLAPAVSPRAGSRDFRWPWHPSGTGRS